MRIRRVLTTAIVPVCLALGFGAGATAATAAPREVTPQRWLRAACTSVSTWLDTSLEADLAAYDAAESISDVTTSRARGKAEMLRQYERIVAASDTMIAAVQKAGVPAIDGGDVHAKKFRDTLGDLREVYADARQAARRLDVKSADLGDEALQIDDDVTTRTDVIGDPLEELKAVPELATLLPTEPACTEVEDTYHAVVDLPYAVGDCFGNDILPAPCTEPHDGEVVLVARHEAPAGTPFPGEDGIRDWVGEQCIPAFAAFVGVDIEASQYDLGWFSPDAGMWTDGNRQVVCYVDTVDDSPLTQSVRGTGA